MVRAASAWPERAKSCDPRRSYRDVTDLLGTLTTEGATMDARRDVRLAIAPTGLVSRRTALRGIGAAGIATALGAAGRAGATEAMTSTPALDPGAGSWSTWVLARGDQLRPPSPPDAAAADAELTDLHALAVERDAAV